MSDRRRFPVPSVFALMAHIIVLSFDHFVDDEPAFEAGARAAVGDLEAHPDAIVLLGMAPDETDADYGWIVPDRFASAEPRRVVRFAEKPNREETARRMAGGAVVNSFILTGRAAPKGNPPDAGPKTPDCAAVVHRTTDARTRHPRPAPPAPWPAGGRIGGLM